MTYEFLNQLCKPSDEYLTQGRENTSYIRLSMMMKDEVILLLWTKSKCEMMMML
jgi:hypothetical protein